MKKFYKMKVLLTGGRAPFTLELLRTFGKEGHEVHILEFISGSLCSYSKYCIKTHIINSPNSNYSHFKSDLINLLKCEQFDIVIPTCEEAIYLSELKTEIDNYTNLFAPNFDLIYKLHNKDLFIKYLQSKGLNTPAIYDHDSVIDKSKTYIVKKKLSRFGGHVQKLKGLQIPATFDFETSIVQEYIKGQEYCLYVILCDGVVTAKSVYFKQLTIGGGATNLFESVNIEIINNWIDDFFKDICLSGQFSFDLFISNDKVYPIECNPRTTSGVHLLRGSLSLNHFTSNKTNQALPNHEKMYMLSIPLLLFSLNPKIFFSAMTKFIKAKDVILSLSDPYHTLGQVFSLFKFSIIAFKKKVDLVEATTLDIAYDKLK